MIVESLCNNNLTYCIYVMNKGIAFDGPDGKDITIVKKEGKVVALEDELLSCKFVLCVGSLIFLK